MNDELILEQEESFVDCEWCGNEIDDEDLVTTQCDQVICDYCYDHSFKCDWCGKRSPDDEHVACGGDQDVCEPCWDEHGELCERCDSKEARDNLHEVLDGCGCSAWYCEDCVEMHTTSCEGCHETIDTNYAHWDDYITLCNSCLDNYVVCDDCGNFIQDDDIRTINTFRGTRYYCDDCYIDHDESCGYDIDRRPYGNLKFVGTGPRYLGVELEIDDRDERGLDHDASCDDVFDIMGEDFVWTTGDGSLRDGFEIVSMPATMEIHYEKPWDKLLKQMLRNGYRSHDAGSCGIHVHVSRKALGDNIECQEKKIALILYLIERFWDQWKRFSRRSQRRLEEWARRYLNSDEPFEEDLILRKAKGNVKYACVSLCRESTLEFRIFRGSLRYETFMAAIELVDSLVAFAARSTIDDVYDITWDELKEELSEGYRFLSEYFEYRNL